jgi:diguanylate cyclase (GGDEF)-like protein
MSHHDSLTGMPNRILLRDRFEQAKAVSKRYSSNIAILCLDLDDFQQVNDSLGHASGDCLIVQVVERLHGCIRESDTVSRQGGDEFIVLLGDMGDLDAIEVIAQKIIYAFNKSFMIKENMLSITVSIGIAIYPNDGKDFDKLFSQADTALRQAKADGKNTYHFFTERMNTDALEHLQLQGQMRQAILNQEFLLYYQPQIDTFSGEVVGAEALIRWQHPQRGLVPPFTFIPLAERSGLIVPLGEWVLHEACRQAQAWRETKGFPSLVMAVNLSALQFKRGNIVETVGKTLERSGLPPECLELELTESVLLHDIDIVLETLHGLKEIGVKLSIDDFGTGYSSMSYLKRLSVDKLKVDQSFVRDMGEDSDDAAIVKAIIQLGHTMQLNVIAEGVETEEQFRLLKKLGCNEVQGYLFSRPIPADDFASLYGKKKSLQ